MYLRKESNQAISVFVKSFPGQNSPVFYLEPDDWSEEVMPKPVLTSPTRALSPCGCGKTHNNHYSHMESLPEEQAEKSVRGTMPTAAAHQKLSKKASESILTLPCSSPRAAMMSELAQPKPTRQRKVTIPILHCRAVSSSLVRENAKSNM